jgi:hypothetical protein
LHTTSRLILIAKKPINRESGNTLDEFRPIAVTSVFFKLLEVIVRKRLLALTNSQSIRRVSREQCGFQPHVGCEANILKLFLEARKAYSLWQASEIRGRPCVVFFDFRSAFDSCDHFLLFREKLGRARIPTDLCNTI